MPRYLVKRTFPGGLAICPGEAAAALFCGVIARNAGLGVTWLHSYVSDDKQTLVCVYDGPTVEAILEAAELNGLPVDSVTEVSVLDPHFYR